MNKNQVPDIKDICDDVRSSLVKFEEEKSLSSLINAHYALDGLRKNYSKNKNLFSPFLHELRELGKRIDSEFLFNRTKLIDEYQSRVIHARDSRLEKEKLRSFLVRQYKNDTDVKIEGTDTFLLIKPVSTLKAPSRKSNNMKVLREALSKADVLDELSVVSGPLLLNSLNKKELDAGTLQVVQETCELNVSYRLQTISNQKQEAPAHSALKSDDEKADDELLTKIAAETIGDDDEAPPYTVEDEDYEIEAIIRDHESDLDDYSRADESGWFYDDDDEKDDAMVDE